jgi:peptidoglycan hydrolase FlgJ
MSLLPATDIVADVAQAADPQRLRSAMRRLAEASPGEPVRKNEFATHVAQIGPRAATAIAPKPAVPAQISGSAPPISGMPEAAQKFEAFLLQSFVEAILPKDDRVFGRGTAGGVWRSMTAEQVGAQLAKSGVLGLEKILARHFGLAEMDGAPQANISAQS